jgi:hypothetical protein
VLSCSFGERMRTLPATWASTQKLSSSTSLDSDAFLMVNESPVTIVVAASVAPIAVPVDVMVSSAGGMCSSPSGPR